MPIDFDCAVCKHRIRVPDGAEGKRTKCPKCQAIQPVPSEADELRLKDSPSEPPPRRSSVSDAFEPAEPPPQPREEKPFAAPSSDSESNPYAAGYGEDAVQVNPARVEAMEKLQTPVLICLVLAGLGIASNLVTLVISVINIIGEAGARGDDAVIQLASYAIGFGFAIGLLGFACFGLMQARDLKSYGLAWAGFIITLLPCSCCFPLSLPISIWGMMVLADNSVQRQFTS